ncbi:hypothetical protein BJX70DRAFT_396471 [Aspergillus crustosus]
MPSEQRRSSENELWKRYATLRDITELADLEILIPMDGYNGYQASPTEDIPGIQNPQLEEGRSLYMLRNQTRQLGHIPIVPKNRFEEWTNMRQKLEAHLQSWAVGVPEAKEAQPLLKLHWVDDKTIRDIEAANKHFLTLRTDKSYENLLDQTVFLVVDHWSYRSYADPSFNDEFIERSYNPGDFQGHVLAVQPEKYTSISQTPEGLQQFDGTVPLLGNLVWPDLYPRLLLRSTGLSDLWISAIMHPQKVYTALTVPVQRASWRSFMTTRFHLLQPYLEHLRGEKPELARTMVRLLMPVLIRGHDTVQK